MLLSFPLALLSSFLVPFESLALLETSANTIGSAPFMFVNILSRSLAGNRPYKTPSSFILRTIALDFTEFFTAASSLNSVNCAVKNSSKLLYFFPLAFKHPVLISYDNPFSKVVRTSFLRRNFPSSSNNRSCADDAIEDAFEAYLLLLILSTPRTQKNASSSLRYSFVRETSVSLSYSFVVPTSHFLSSSSSCFCSQRERRFPMMMRSNSFALYSRC